MVREPLSRSFCESDDRYVAVSHEKNDDGTYTVTFANGSSGVFGAEEYFKYDLFATEEENRRTYSELIHEVNYNRCRAMSLSLVKASPKPSALVRMKMLSKGFSEDIVDEAIEELTSEGEIDDRLYAEKYAREKADKGKSSRNLVVRELAAKGIDDEIACEAVEKFFTDDEPIAREIAEKKAKNGDGYEKIARYLLGKGFRQGLVMDVLGDIFGEN